MFISVLTHSSGRCYIVSCRRRARNGYSFTYNSSPMVEDVCDERRGRECGGGLPLASSAITSSENGSLGHTLEHSGSMVYDNTPVIIGAFGDEQGDGMPWSDGRAMRRGFRTAEQTAGGDEDYSGSLLLREVADRSTSLIEGNDRGYRCLHGHGRVLDVTASRNVSLCVVVGVPIGPGPDVDDGRRVTSQDE